MKNNMILVLLLISLFIAILLTSNKNEYSRLGVEATVIKAEYHSEGYSSIKHEPLYIYYLDTDSNGSANYSVVAFIGSLQIPPALQRIGQLNQKVTFDLERPDGKTWQVVHANL